MLNRVPCRHFSQQGRRKRFSPVLHQSQRGPARHDIDFSRLGLKYQVDPSKEFTVPRLGWRPPPETPPDIPFHVERTVSDGQALPVYTDYKNGRTKIVTVLRRCSGDIDLLREEMEKVVESHVEVRPGRLHVDGNYHMRLKKWLVGLGF